MKFKSQLAAVGGTLAVVAAGASVALVGGISSSSAAEAPSSAYGLVATGLIPIQKTPTITSTSGGLVTNSLIALPSNPLLSGGVINVRAKNGFAHSDVANLSVGGGLLSQVDLSQVTSALQPVCSALSGVSLSQLNTAVGGILGSLGSALTTLSGATGIDLSAIGGLDMSNLLPDQLSGLCDTLNGVGNLVGVGAIATECHGTTGTVHIANLKAVGLPIKVDTSKIDSKISVPGVLTLEINRQTHNSDGSFTVDGLVIDLLGRQEIVLTSATCGKVSHRTGPTDAPTPTPTHTKAPVTG